MQPRIPHVVAALLLATGTTFASAQAQPQPIYVAEPIASTSAGASGPNAELASRIAQALAADASLKNSKITVQPDENGILLTGVTPTLAQMGRAISVATQHAGEAIVGSAILTEEVWLEAG